MQVDSLTLQLLPEFLIAGVLIGVVYALMALGISFIFNVMRMINWAMGEFYMIGSFVQYFLVASFLGPNLWWLALPITAGSVFLLGCLVQRVLLSPMYARGFEQAEEYATVMTIALMLLLRSLATALSGPYTLTPPSNLGNFNIGPLSVSGAQAAAGIGGLLATGLFILFLNRTWWGLAFRAAAQNRVGAATSGVNLGRIDMIGFGIGVGMAAVAGGLLAPVYLVYPTNGLVTTTKGFEIIIIGGLGSLSGAVVGGLILGLVESLGALFFAAEYKDVYGFLAVIVILLLRPNGLFGERAREG